jgi:acetyl-CoA acetyltransferase
MSPQAAAVIVDAVRTPAGKGKPGGAPSGVHPVDLLAGDPAPDGQALPD